VNAIVFNALVVVIAAPPSHHGGESRYEVVNDYSLSVTYTILTVNTSKMLTRNKLLLITSVTVEQSAKEAENQVQCSEDGRKHKSRSKYGPYHKMPLHHTHRNTR
jgi:hypothetical protein